VVLTRDKGRVVFVHYALPGEVVRVEPWGKRGGAAFARAVEVLEPSPDRTAPPCPHFGACGGCQWQHAVYARQLALKLEVVGEVWARAGLRLPPDTPVHGMEHPWRYRVRGEFEATYEPGSGRLALGFHRPRSHAVLPVETCAIHDERIERAMLAVRRAGQELGVQGLTGLHLTVEPQGPGVLWRPRFQQRAERAQAPALAERVAELLPDLVLLDDSMSLDFWDLRFRVRSDTFIQTNYRQMLALYQTVLDMLEPGPGDRILDCYSGIGTISLAIGRRAAGVTAIEESGGAVQLGRLAARINEVPGVRFVAGRVEDVLAQLRLGEHEAAVLDPPRAGCEPGAIAELLRLSPERLVYVSCEPSTHARDVARLVQGGYRVRRVALVDMFPHTYHVESVALLERARG
jgi:23S rRNA (uracil1939-C5)-methyltransferase